MKKKNVLWTILNSIFLIVFNALFFTLSDNTEHNASVWISYGFIHFAYLMLLITPKLIRKGGKSTAVFGFSLYAISSVYFLIQFVTGLAFILVAPESFKAALIIQLCLAGLYCIMLISHMLSNEYTAEAEEKRQSQIEYIKDVSAQLKSLLEKISDKETKKKVERVYDAIYSSPVKSHPSLAQMEKNIIQSVNDLEHEVTTGHKEKTISLANSILSLINERNQLLKKNKPV